MIDEYIKRSDAIKEISKAPAYFDNSDVQYGLVLAESIIEDIPAADVVEVVHGEWVKYKAVHYKCSVCGNRVGGITTKYCSECGAKMNGSVDE